MSCFLIFGQTIKENILFGKPFHEEKYKQAIFAANLEPDLNILPAGDATEIGERYSIINFVSKSLGE